MSHHFHVVLQAERAETGQKAKSEAERAERGHPARKAERQKGAIQISHFF
jgi:hypothetical protein